MNSEVNTLRFAARLALVLAGFQPSGFAAGFPKPYNTEPNHAGPMPATAAAARMTLPPGFKATVFAAEPEVQNPIAMAWDGRGRLWIAENYTYAEGGRRFDLGLRDRILIFEDKQGDGRFSSRKIFTDELQMLTSLEVGRGGVWVTCPPNVFFIPDRNGDDVPDGAPEVVLDGFAVPKSNYHTFVNGLRFGPDGWLYGRVGSAAVGEIGAPGTPPAQRVPARGGMWRYHPERKLFEMLTAGTTNPWGHDWDEHGELFHINTLNGHLWHAFAGAHFMRFSTPDPNPRVYALIDTHADHWHFDTGKRWQDSRAGAANAFGGGHSHIGAMIYLGDNWPSEYRGHLLTLNQHGRRANREILERRGAGYAGRHGRDFLVSADPWFVGLDLRYGPDGAVFVLDWSDAGECHEYSGIHRTSGRIFKIAAGEPRRVDVGDLGKLDSTELVKLHLHANEWFVRQARLELIARASAGRNLAAAREQLRVIFGRRPEITSKLRAMWSLHAIGGLDDVLLRAQLRHPDEHVRTWAVRLLSDAWPLDTVMSVRPKWRPDFAAAEKTAPRWQGELLRLAREDNSALVRLALASTLQRLPTGQRPALAAALVAHREDAGDHNLPLLIWCGLIPVGDENLADLVNVARQCELPRTREFIARRLAEDIQAGPGPLNDLLIATAAHASPNFAADILAGVSATFAGWRKAPKPAAWDALAQELSARPDAALRDGVRKLSVLFGDGRALDEVRTVALDPQAGLKQRQAALQTLIDSHAPDVRTICEQLLEVAFLNPVAACGLAAFDDPAVGDLLVKAYRRFYHLERPQLLATLVSRVSFARALLEAVGAGRIDRTDLTPFLVRQIRSFDDPALSRKLGEVWGEMRESPAETQRLIARFKQQLTPAVLARADKSNGRAVFGQACIACHRLYGEGGDFGPDLSGSGRANLDYLLENVADPNAVVTADFRRTSIELKDGRILSGLVMAKNDRVLTLKTMTEKQVIERSEIARLQETPASLMPEGLLQTLNDAQVRDLFAYLMHPSQVPHSIEAR
ncbi:MAG: c-type cytochrome [Verrucomicrobia bacterium]|nr:c-type cytochrome [Verrucomicrobiota bacterium]